MNVPAAKGEIENYEPAKNPHELTWFYGVPLTPRLRFHIVLS